MPRKYRHLLALVVASVCTVPLAADDVFSVPDVERLLAALPSVETLFPSASLVLRYRLTTERAMPPMNRIKREAEESVERLNKHEGRTPTPDEVAAMAENMVKQVIRGYENQAHRERIVQLVFTPDLTFSAEEAERSRAQKSSFAHAVGEYRRESKVAFSFMVLPDARSVSIARGPSYGVAEVALGGRIQSEAAFPFILMAAQNQPMESKLATFNDMAERSTSGEEPPFLLSLDLTGPSLKLSYPAPPVSRFSTVALSLDRSNWDYEETYLQTDGNTLTRRGLAITEPLNDGFRVPGRFEELETAPDGSLIESRIYELLACEQATGRTMEDLRGAGFEAWAIAPLVENDGDVKALLTYFAASGFAYWGDLDVLKDTLDFDPTRLPKVVD